MAKLEIDSDLCSFYITLASLWQPTYNAKTISQNFLSVLPQSHTHLRTLTESFVSNRSRPQKNEGGA